MLMMTFFILSVEIAIAMMILYLMPTWEGDNFGKPFPGQKVPVLECVDDEVEPEMLVLEGTQFEELLVEEKSLIYVQEFRPDSLAFQISLAHARRRPCMCNLLDLGEMVKPDSQFYLDLSHEAVHGEHAACNHRDNIC